MRVWQERGYPTLLLAADLVRQAQINATHAHENTKRRDSKGHQAQPGGRNANVNVDLKLEVEALPAAPREEIKGSASKEELAAHDQQAGEDETKLPELPRRIAVVETMLERKGELSPNAQNEV